jgi:hypothetical protein
MVEEMYHEFKKSKEEEKPKDEKSKPSNLENN